MRKTYIIALVLMQFAFLLGTLDLASAYNPFGGVECSKTSGREGSAVCESNSGDPLTGPGGIFLSIANLIAIAAGIAAIILILVGSIRMITSGGDPGKIKKARDTVIYSLVGIAVIILARSIIVYVVRSY